MYCPAPHYQDRDKNQKQQIGDAYVNPTELQMNIEFLFLNQADLKCRKWIQLHSDIRKKLLSDEIYSFHFFSVFISGLKFT